MLFLSNTKKFKKINSFFLKNKVYIACIVILATVFLLTRLYNLEGRFGFDYDQEKAAEAAWTIIKEKKLILIGQETSIGGLFVGPFIFWFQSIGMLIGSMNPIALAYQATLIAFVTFIVIIFVVSDIFDKWQGLLAGLIYTMSPRIISFDLISNPQSYIMLPSILIFWLMHRVIFRNQTFLLPIVFFLLGLSFHIHLTMALFIIPVLILIFLKKTKFTIFNIFWSLIAFIIPLLTFPLFEIRHHFLITNNLLAFATQQSNISHLTRVTEIIPVYAGLFTEVIFFHNKYSFFIFLIFISFFIYKKKNRNLLYFIFSFMFLPQLAFLFYKGLVPEYYFLPVVPIFIIIGSFVYKSLVKYHYLILPLVIIILTYNLINKYQSTNARSLKIKRMVVEKILDDTADNSFNLYSNLPLAINNGFNYLFKWQSRLPQEGGKNIYIFEFKLPYELDLADYHRSFPKKNITYESFDLIQLIKVKD